MAVDIPSFLVDDDSIPKLTAVPQKPKMSGYSPYPAIPRKQRTDDGGKAGDATKAKKSPMTEKVPPQKPAKPAQKPPKPSKPSDTKKKAPPIPSTAPYSQQAASASMVSQASAVKSPPVPSPTSVPSPSASETSNPPIDKFPFDHRSPREWTNERVIWWLETNEFSSQWIDKFRELQIHGDQFFSLVSYSAIKPLGVLESPYRFVKLLRQVVPPQEQPQHNSPSRVSTSPIAKTPEEEESSARINPFLASSRRTSFEKYLFLSHSLRPRRSTAPGPSVLVTQDGVDFKLVSINEVESGPDLRRAVYKAIFRVDIETVLKDAKAVTPAELATKCVLKLTDYFSHPGGALSDAQLWQILSAAAGDIVKFEVEAQAPPHLQGHAMRSALTMPSREVLSPATTPGWNMSSEDAVSPPEEGRVYPRTPAYLIQEHNANSDYFNIETSSSSLPRGRRSSVDQLVAKRAAPKPPLARSLSSKYRPELSPVTSSPVFSEDADAFGHDGDGGDIDDGGADEGEDDMWADAPQLEDSSDSDSANDNGLVYMPPATAGAKPSNLPQLRIPRTSSHGARAQLGSDTIVEEAEESPSADSRRGLKPSQHKHTLSESSMDSPRSPGAAALERASIDWASRPPAEILYDNLEKFFPNADLDEPVVVQNKTIPPVPGHPAPPIPRAAQHANSEDDTRSEGAKFGRAKSIRVVAREASRRLTQRGRESNANLLRRKSTKMWGQRVVEMRKGTPNSVTLRDHKQYVWVKGELIGRGSFGKVYLGLNATSGDMMAVKQVRAPRNIEPGTSLDESMRALYAEVENMKDLDHLNIVQYLGFERLDRVSNLFLEYVPGGSVNSLLRNFGRFPDDTIRFLTRQVLEGLAYLHSRGILHRDLKADNLLLDLDGTIKISDFGISKRSRDIYANDAEMSMQGTIFWMAPEVIHNVIKNQKQGYSAKVDVWSLGCVILEMFVGRRPWSTEEAIGAMYKLGSSKQAPPIPEDVKPHVSPEGISFLDCCFLIDPKQRPTAKELLNHAFSAPNSNYNFATSKLAIDMKRSVKRTSRLLKTQQLRSK